MREVIRITVQWWTIRRAWARGGTGVPRANVPTWGDLVKAICER